MAREKHLQAMPDQVVLPAYQRRNPLFSPEQQQWLTSQSKEEEIDLINFRDFLDF
jgi:hypothetical protein